MSNNIRNTIYEGRMYRPEIKEEFLSMFPSDSQRPYRRIFFKSCMLEEMWNKDLCDFSLSEIEQLLTALSPLTVGASRINISVIDRYVNWCIPNYTTRQTNVSPLKFLRTDKDFIKKFVDESAELYISKEEVDDIIHELQDPQDSSIISALFNGVTIRQIANMLKKDINDDGTVYIRDNDGKIILDHETGEPFKLDVGYQCTNLLNQAAKSKEYLVKNGLPDEGAKYKELALVDSDYVIRIAVTSRNADKYNQPVGYHILSNRVKMAAELIDNPLLTPGNINKSGLIYRGYKLWVEAGKPDYPNGKLTTEQYQTILKQLNKPKTKNGTYNTNPLRDYVTIENFKKYYPED